MSSIDRRLGFGVALGATGALIAALLLRNVALLLVALALGLVLPAIFYTRVRNAALVLIATLCALSLAELLAALLMEDGRNGTRFDTHSDYVQRYLRQTDIGSQARPGVHSSRKFGPQGELVYDVRYTIGADGFRVTPNIGDRSSGAELARVNFFGCSFLFGEGLEDDETLPFFVAARTAAVNVKNFGFHGYGAHQALAILTSQRDTSGTLNVFLAAPWQVTRSACKPEWSAGSPQYVLESGTLRRVGRCRQGSALGRVLNYSKIYWLVQAARGVEAPTDADFRLYLAIVREMAALSRARGQRWVLGYLKADAAFFRGTSYSNERLYEELARGADGSIDLTLAANAETLPSRYVLHPLDRHPSALANQARAELLAGLLNFAPPSTPAESR